MLATAVARWMIAVQLAVAAFAIGFIAADFVALHLHGTPMATIGLSGATGTIAAGIVGILIVPPRTRRTARRVFGGVPVAAAVSSLLWALAGHVLTAPNFCGVVGMLFAGYIVVKAFRRQPEIA